MYNLIKLDSLESIMSYLSLKVDLLYGGDYLVVIT